MLTGNENTTTFLVTTGPGVAGLHVGLVYDWAQTWVGSMWLIQPGAVALMVAAISLLHQVKVNFYNLHTRYVLGSASSQPYLATQAALGLVPLL